MSGSGGKSILSSVMDVFRAPAVQAPASTALGGTPPNNNTVPGATPTGTEGVPGGTPSGVAAIPPTATGDKSPLDGFSKLWETSKDEPSATPSLAPDLKLDPKAIAESVSKINFTQHIKPETIKAALEGNAEAFASAINTAVQASVGVMTQTFGTGLNNALKAQNDKFYKDVMPEVLRQHSAGSAISEQNPIFDNPVLKPMLDMAKQRLTQQYPDASPAEIATHAKQLVSGMAEEIVRSQGGTVVPGETATPGGGPGPSKKIANADTDWSKWLS